MGNETINKFILDYLVKYKDLPTRTLAKIIYHDNPYLFKNLEYVRRTVRYYRGASGKKDRKTVLNKYGKTF